MERKRKENGFEHRKKDSGLKLICYSREIITFQGACVCVLSWSYVRLFVTPWTIACQAPLSMGFPRQDILERVAISYSRGSSQLITSYYLFQACIKVMREEAEIDDFMEVKPPALSHRIASTQKNWLGPQQVYSIKWHSRIFKPPKSGDFVFWGLSGMI